MLHAVSIPNTRWKVKAAGLLAGALLTGFAGGALAAFDIDPGGPRATAMGGAGIAVSGDRWAGLRNPALWADAASGAAVSWSQQFGLPELTREHVAAVARLGGHAIGIQGSNFGGSLYREGMFGVGVAQRVRPEIWVGADVRGCWLDIRDYPSSRAMTVTAGALLQPVKGMSVAVVWRNLNEPRMSGCRDRVSERLTVGVAARVSEAAQLAADIVQEKTFPAELRIGVEARFLPAFTLAVGARAEPVRPSAGFRLHLGRYVFSYAGDVHPDLGASHECGLDMRLGR